MCLLPSRRGAEMVAFDIPYYRVTVGVPPPGKNREIRDIT